MNLTEPLEPQEAEIASLPHGPAPHTFRRVVKYVLVKAITILVTIFIGVFITVVLADRGGQIEASVNNEVMMTMNTEFENWSFYYSTYSPDQKAVIDQRLWELQDAAGLHLSYWPRQLKWTVRVLSLDWMSMAGVTTAPGLASHSRIMTAIILLDLPNTLLLVGTSFFLLFVIGIPLSLYLFRVHGSRLDRLMTLLAAITPVPSWVLAVLLVIIFSVGLHWLPPSGMYDPIPATTGWGQAVQVFRHMLLPVMAILFSLLLQCVYSWRTFFLIFAEEDYVELAKAKGLPDRLVERNYILRPTLPYILTSFSILLVSFWQMTIALEKILNWPGIGRLYIMSLPNFFGEQMYSGIMPVTLGIVVLFAYMLGTTVFVLDILYALVDPRIRIGDERRTPRRVAGKRRRFKIGLSQEIKAAQILKSNRAASRLAQKMEETTSKPLPIKQPGQGLKAIRNILREIGRFPSAVIGLSIILILIAGSLYAVIVYPYNQLGDAWYSHSLTGVLSAPRVAQPVWVNWFRRNPLPPMIILDSQEQTATKSVQTGSNGSTITLTYTIPYNYGAFPQGMVLYFDSKFVTKQPFAVLTWTTPDGRSFDIGRFGTSTVPYYTFIDGTYIRQILSNNPGWANWFHETGTNPSDPSELLFADPASDTGKVLQGTYTLRVEGVTFEQGSELDARMVLIGQVYGWAGTDYYRRDLVVPLLWGLPFALVFGLLGACVTTVLSMVLAATGVWYGGWVDDLIQRLVEANMILPVIGIAVLIYAYFNVGIWTILGIVVLLNVFGSPIKSFRSALLQVKDSLYIEAARAYGASDSRIIFRYLVPRIIPTLIPQLVILIPSYVFLEATLGIFNVYSIYPTWGRIISEALAHGGVYGSSFWVLEPIALLLLTGLAFAMLGFSLERILNPRIMKD